MTMKTPRQEGGDQQEAAWTPPEWTPTFARAGSGTARLALSLAISDYDHVRDLVEGRVPVAGADLVHLPLSLEEIFFRFTRSREWEISEMSMAKFASLISQGDTSITAIPVFPSRMFRHSSIYVRKGSGITDARQLAGRRVGLPEWAQTAAIYTRGVLAHQFGLSLADIHWVQAGVNQPGRTEKVALRLPDGVEVTARPDSSLEALLLEGAVDAVLSAHPPRAYDDGHPDIIRLYEEHRDMEEAYWRETGVFPIMHAVVIRTAVLERFPWLAANLVSAFEQAKRNSVARLTEMTASRYPLPWLQDVAKKSMANFGGDMFPYGVEANRCTLQTFLQYAHEQGVCHRRVAVEELFPATVMSSFRV